MYDYKTFCKYSTWCTKHEVSITLNINIKQILNFVRNDIALKDQL